MKPIDYRNATWADIQDRLSGLRQSAYRAWVQHGPGTTREVAQRSGMDLLTFRPRTTELLQLGLVEVVEDPGVLGRDIPGEGAYRAVPMHQAALRFEEAREAARNPQLSLL
jgi:hypothetical protein